MNQAMLRSVGWVMLPVCLLACAPQRTLLAELQPRSLHALNLEETLSRRDEVMLAYSLTVFDAANKAVSVVNGAWGVEKMKRAQTIDLVAKAQPISLSLPRKGRAVVSIVLIEVDNYSQASELLSQIQKIHNMISLPVGLLLTTTEVITPLKYVTGGLLAAGLGVQLADQLDTDDVLGQSSFTISEAESRQSKQRLIRIPATFSGRHFRDAYSYELTYDVILKTVQIKQHP